MTKSKVDTKALEEMQNPEAAQTADILFDSDKLTLEALELIVSVYGTDDSVAKAASPSVLFEHSFHDLR